MHGVGSPMEPPGWRGTWSSVRKPTCLILPVLQTLLPDLTGFTQVKRFEAACGSTCLGEIAVEELLYMPAGMEIKEPLLSLEGAKLSGVLEERGNSKRRFFEFAGAPVEDCGTLES